MTEIATHKHLMEVSTRLGVPMKNVEAEIVFGYLEGHDYHLAFSDGGDLWMCNNQDEDHDDALVTIRDIVEFCQEKNGELLEEASNEDFPDALLELRKDEFILVELLKKATGASPQKKLKRRKYRVELSELRRGTVIVDAASEEEAKIAATGAEIDFYDEAITEITVEEAPAQGYQKIINTEPLILEPEDWTFQEWATICTLCDLPVMTTERIVLHVDEIECYINPDGKLVNADSGRTNIVTEVCPNCENEIEMRWSVEEFGYKATCPVCGGRLMLCDECQHRYGGEHTGDCDYDSETDTCKFNRK